MKNKEELIALIRNGQTETAIDTLLDKNKFILEPKDDIALNLLSSRLVRATDSYRNDQISREQYNREINQIDLTLINFLSNNLNESKQLAEVVKNEKIKNKKLFKFIIERIIFPLLLSLSTLFFYPQQKDIVHFNPMIKNNTIKFKFRVLKNLTNLDTFDFYFSIRDTSSFKIAQHTHNLYPTNLDVTDEIITNNDKFEKFKHQKTNVDLSNETEFGWEIKIDNLTEKKIQARDFYFNLAPSGKNPFKSSIAISWYDYLNFHPFAFPCIIFSLWQIFFSKLHYIRNSIFMKTSLRPCLKILFGQSGYTV